MSVKKRERERERGKKKELQKNNRNIFCNTQFNNGHIIAQFN
jgi:hypothetical protein